MTRLENEWGNTSEDTGEVSVEAESEEFQMPKNGAPPSLEHGSRHEYAMRYRIVLKHL